MDVDGTNLRDLTTEEGDCSHAAWSPDGQIISFWVLGSDRSGLYTMNPDGSNKRRIDTHMDMDVVWSPDGLYLAAWNLQIKGGVSVNDLVILKPDGSGRVIMTNFDKAYRLLSWSR